MLIIISSLASGMEPCIPGEGGVWISHIRAWASFFLWAQLTQVAASGGALVLCVPRGLASRQQQTVHIATMQPHPPALQHPTLTLFCTILASCLRGAATQTYERVD